MDTTRESVERTLSNEYIHGFRVVAYMEDVDTELGLMHRFSEHWSTPGKGAKNVQRLFAEADLRALLARAEAAEAERDRQYDENVHRIAEQAKAEAERDALQAKLAVAVAFIEDLEGCEWPIDVQAKRILVTLTADTIPDPHIEGWNAAIEAAAKVYEGTFDTLAQMIRAIPCPYTPKEGKDDDT